MLNYWKPLLGLITAIAGSNTFLYFRESNTDFKIINADRRFITISTENRGLRPSTLKHFELVFDKTGLEITQAHLTLMPVADDGQTPLAKAVIGKQEDDVRIRLEALATLKATCRPAIVCREEIRRKLAVRPMRLMITIEESGNPWYFWQVFHSTPHTHTEPKELPEDFRAAFIEGACCDEPD
ncbi:MAG: hypothetical protein DMF56_22475 [Acidobacteria bacterium]|nr:MAG: hypothetical protein DMF56_22475 [Acidobacteriota bacterium]